MANDSVNLVKKLGLDILGGRYSIVQPIGDSFGGVAFIGEDSVTNNKVFIKYLICHRGAPDLAKFLMEKDALKHFQTYPSMKVAPELLYFEEFPHLLSAVIVTEFVEGESLTNWLSRIEEIGLDERLAVFHRVVMALSYATLTFRHRDIHPGNILLLAEKNVSIGPQFRDSEVDPGIRIIDWGESLPVIFGNYDDEPDHNFVLLESAPRQIGGSITSLPPEVFAPWEKDTGFGGKYESWGLGLLLHRILSDRQAPRVESIGHYVQSITNGTLKNWVRTQVATLSTRELPGGCIIPRLLKQMLQIAPSARLTLSDVGRVLWDVRYEELTISDEPNLEKYFSDPRNYEPSEGWRFSFFPDLD